MTTTKTAVVTGANSGIGLATARGLAARGYRTVLLCRNADRAAAALASIEESVPDATAEIVLCDLGNQASVRVAAAELGTRLDRIDVLVNNAGVTLRAPSRTAENHDEMLAVNHLGPFLLTNELRPLLASSAPARIVNVSSNAHRIAKRVDLEHLDHPSGYGVLGFGRYGETKLMNILWTRELARRLDGMGITANALHPGGVRTNLGNPPKPVIAVVGLFLVSPEKGAETSLYLATDPAVDGVTGAYWAKSRRADGKLSSAARDDDQARRLWEASEALVATQFDT